MALLCVRLRTTILQCVNNIIVLLLCISLFYYVASLANLYIDRDNTLLTIVNVVNKDAIKSLMVPLKYTKEMLRSYPKLSLNVKVTGVRACAVLDITK